MSADESLNLASRGARMGRGSSATGTLTVCLAVTSTTSAESVAANRSALRTKSAPEKLAAGGGAGAAAALPDSVVVASTVVAMAATTQLSSGQRTEQSAQLCVISPDRGG
jgi:hypothetical protein